MKAKAMAVRGAAVTVAGFALLACSSGDPAPADPGGQAGTNGVTGGTASVAGSSSNVGGTAQPSAGSGGAAGSSSGGISSGGGAGGSSAGNSAAGSNAAGGSAGAAGNGGSGSGGGAGGSGGGKAGAKPSMGCNQAATGALNMWVESMVMSGGANRPYSVRLPTGYDQTRAYPVVVLLHGCSGGTNNVPMEKATGTDAILVRGTGSASGTCWNSGATGPDVTFFDAMVKDVKTRFCADENRFFIVGYSSGSWLVNQLTCIRADVVRGGASVSGGETAGNNCGGPVARIFLHDTDDNDNVISGSVKARDRQITQNMCTKPATAMPVDPSPCTQYQGCAAGNPVNWCQTSGKQHGRQDDFAPAAFWNFFKSL